MPGWAALLWSITLAGGAFFLLLYLGIAALRLRYPYHLEWIEGGSLCQVRWILGGHPLYLHPHLRFTSFPYPPLYFYTSAAFATLLGDGLLPLRLVSLLSSLGSLLLLFRIASREASHPAAGVLAASLFAATFPLSGGWFDLARVDSMFLFFVLGSLYLVRFGRSRRSAAAAAAVLALGYLTKQSALVVAAPFALWFLLAQRRRFAAFAGTFTALVLGGSLLLDRLHHGWFWFYLFELPLSFPALRLPVLSFLAHDIVSSLAIALALVALALLLGVRRRHRPRPDQLFYPLLGLVLLALTYLIRRKDGAYINDLMPIHAWIAIVFGLAVVDLRRRLAGLAAQVAVSLLCLAQFALLIYYPRTHLPTPADRRAGDEIVARLRTYKGDVFLPEFGYLAGLAGKPIYGNSMATMSILQGENPQLREEMLHEIQEAVRQDRFEALLFALPDWSEEPLLGKSLGDYRGSRIVYRPAPGGTFAPETKWELGSGPDLSRPEPTSDAFLPRTGYLLRPIFLYTLKRQGGARAPSAHPARAIVGQ